MAIERPTRNSVVTSSTVGNAENASGEAMYIATMRSTAAEQMLKAMSVSTSGIGSGRIIMKMTATMTNASATSVRFAPIRIRRVA